MTELVVCPHRFSCQYTPESGKKIAVLDLGKPYSNELGDREKLFHIAAELKHLLKLLLLKAGFFGLAVVLTLMTSKLW